jgi:hypothetical protein
VVSTFTPVSTSPTVPTETNLLHNSYPLGRSYCDPSHYRAVYDIGGTIPGSFVGQGDTTTKFVYNSNALTSDDFVSFYNFSADFISDGTTFLTYSPSNPQLVLNTTVGTIYQGVLDSTSAKIIESWDSGITGYANYAQVHSTGDSSNASQMARSSAVEVHFFMRTDSSNLSGGVLKIDSSAIPYAIHTVRQVYNRTSGFAHPIKNVAFISSQIQITPVVGYGFNVGLILEITADVISNNSSTNVRNGASCNFNSRLRSINHFTRSEIVTTSSNEIAYTDREILGWSSAHTALGLNQAICWDAFSMKQIDVERDPNKMKIILTPIDPLSGDATVQLLTQTVSLTGSLQVGYNYIPHQTQNLPSTLVIEPVQGPINLYVSNLGSGGGLEGPFDLPLEHIPVNSNSITDDRIFNNLVQLRLANYYVSSGFLQLPVNVPATFFGSSITLSSLTQDTLGRIFYSACSKELVFEGEGLQLAVPRKVYLPILGRIKNDNSIFMPGEYALTIFSRPVLTDRENKTGYFAQGNCSISIYRIPNRPISRA